METISTERENSSTYSQSTFWRDPISDLADLPPSSSETNKVDTKDKKRKEETKAPGISLPISEMSYDWMDDNVAMGSIDTDEDENVTETKEVEKSKTENHEKDSKPKGITLPIEDVTF